MAEGFLQTYLLITGAWTLLGALLGYAIAKRSRIKGAVIGTFIGLLFGSVMTSAITFAPSSPKETATVTIE